MVAMRLWDVKNLRLQVGALGLGRVVVPLMRFAVRHPGGGYKVRETVTGKETVNHKP